MGRCRINERNLSAVVCDPADDVQMEWIIKEFSKIEGIHYVRANRKAVRNVYQKGSEFEIGKGNILKQGDDILIIAAGQLVSEALDCAEALEKEDISTEVIDMFTIKPLDENLLIKEAKGKEKSLRLKTILFMVDLEVPFQKLWQKME